MGIKGSANPRHPTPVDVHVGLMVRIQRTLVGMTQADLAVAVGLAYQQIQKYEAGSDRISAGRLYEFSRVFKVPVARFFDELEQDDIDGTLSKRETFEMVRSYGRITDTHVRKAIRNLIHAVADGL